MIGGREKKKQLAVVKGIVWKIVNLVFIVNCLPVYDHFHLNFFKETIVF